MGRRTGTSLKTAVREYCEQEADPGGEKDFYQRKKRFNPAPSLFFLQA